MVYRPLPDPNEILDVEVETPEMVENARLVACGERQLRMLRRMGDIGIGLVERLEQIAMSKAEGASGEGAAPASIDDIAGAYGKLTQSLRRTLAMEARLAEEMKARRLGVFTTRNNDREETIKVVHEGVDETVEYALAKAIRRERPDADRETVEHLLIDMFERLNDADEFEDYHQRPPGETVAKLCAAFGLDPDFCIQADDETWMIRHGAAEPDTPSPPSPSWGGTDAESVRVGNADLSAKACKAKVDLSAKARRAKVEASTDPGNPDIPHPDGFTVCPSP